ncbi:MAG TPA: hypothetical protein DGT23_29830 [Micromonosporaceae bacterium]|nr:hypothetical protein [Micromonosporaceae bacterium]
MWNESPDVRQMGQLYPSGGAYPFQIGHLPYIRAVTATFAARGLTVQHMRLPQWPFDAATGVRTAEIQLGAEVWGERYPAAAVPFTVTWSESHGWNYTAGTAADNGLDFGPGDDMVLRSRGLGPAVSLVADPHQVADAVQAFLAGTAFEPAGWAGRNPAVQDVRLEAALGAYRQHPGALALAGLHRNYETTRSMLASLEPATLAGLSQRPAGLDAATLDARAAQVRVSAVRYEVSALTAADTASTLDAASARETLAYSAFVEPADASGQRWVVLARQRTVPAYLSADGQQTSQPAAYDFDTAMQVARTGAVLRREGPNALTADEFLAARTGNSADLPLQQPPERHVVGAAWARPLRQSLQEHTLRQGIPATARAQSPGRERRDQGLEK